jgi:hypothetical protein
MAKKGVKEVNDYLIVNNCKKIDVQNKKGGKT